MEVPTTMKAWRAHSYGENRDVTKVLDKMTFEDVPVPTVGEGQVFIKVQFASVNPIDWKLMTGDFDAFMPLKFPYTPGLDISGTVVKTNACSKIAVGASVCCNLGIDPSFGPCGAFAEYAVVPENLVALHTSASPEQACAVVTGVTAYQALLGGADRPAIDGSPQGSLQAGQKVLVLGGITAVGSIAIQLAKQLGAFVATTGSTNKMPDGMSKVDFLKKLGSDVVIDYRVDDWAEVLGGQGFDLIFDCVGDMKDWDKCAPVLKKGGFFLSTANFGQAQQLDGPIFKVMMVTPNAKDLGKLVTHVETGAIKVPIDSIASFDAAREAIAKSLKGQASGKIIVDVAGHQ